MQRFLRPIVVPAMFLAAAIASAEVKAGTPEEAYIAARNSAIAKIKAAADAEKQGPSDSASAKIEVMDKDALRALESQMRAIVGTLSIKDLEKTSAINLDTLIEGELGYGLLDGMVYGPIDGKTRVIVTTESLLRRWLREHKDWWGKDFAPMPQEPGAAVKENAFYTQAVQTDAAVIRFAELPIRKPGSRFAFAMLAARSQSETPAQADEIFLAVAQGGRVFIAYTKDFAAVGPIAPCDTLRAVAAAAEPGLDEQARAKKADALSAQSEAEFLRCFAQRAPRHGGFADAVKAAQVLADRLPAR